MMQSKGYVVGRVCQDCEEEGHEHQIAYLLDTDIDDITAKENKKRKIFRTKKAAVCFIEEILDMSEEEVMIIPAEEVIDDE